MASRPSIRSLAALREASSSRVLNLHAVSREHATPDNYTHKPLFDSPTLNNAILVKHHLFPDDYYLFKKPITNATKIILPLDKGDLFIGGTSFFCEQRGYENFLKDLGRYGERSMARDVKILGILNDLPSFDPFLVRERLAMENVRVADYYFELSDADKRDMHTFVENVMTSLVTQVFKDDSSPVRAGEKSAAARFAAAMLAVGAEDQLEPLRKSLMLEGDQFRQGIFSWRGLLYYTWQYADLFPKVKQVLQEIVEMPVSGGVRPGDVESARKCKRRLGHQITTVGQQVAEAIAQFDTEYAKLTEGQDPRAFRDFLLGARTKFVDLGEKLGGLSHIETFWRFRFPEKQTRPIPADDVIPIFIDFMANLGMTTRDLDLAA